MKKQNGGIMMTVKQILEKISTGITNNLGRTGIFAGKYRMAVILIKK
jgi:hypothetical protein